MITEGLYDADYFLTREGPKVVLMTRENKEKKFSVHNFRPYIYTSRKCYEANKTSLMPYIYNVEIPKQVYIKEHSLELMKITLKSPFDVYEVKKFLDDTYESDILFINRFIIDNVEEMKPANHRMAFFDIETTTNKGFPSYLNPVENLVSISNYDNYDDKYINWIWHSKYKNEVINKEMQGGINVEIRRYTNEKDMLEDYIKYLSITQPDYLLAWNIEFDIRYFIARSEYLKINVAILSPLYDKGWIAKDRLVEWKNGPAMHGKKAFGQADDERHVKIKGLKTFDLLMGYKIVVANEQQSWKLDDIAEIELGVKKLRTHFDVGKTWEKDPEFIENYNYVDVYLIKQLDGKLGIFNRYNTIKNTAFLVNILDTFSSGRVLDNYILKRFKDQYIFPRKVFDEGRDVTVAGGFVRDPIAGKYNNIAVFDFSGFYPNIIRTFNLSGDVLKVENVFVSDKEVDEVQDVTDMLKDRCYTYDDDTGLITYQIRTEKFKADLTYTMKQKGVMATSTEKLMELRNQMKREMKQFPYGSVEYVQKDKQQFSYKFLINAAYGTSAFPGFRLFSTSNANAITGFARMMSKWVSYRLNELGWKTVGGDTDSLFIQLKESKELEDNLKEIEKVQLVINKAIDEFALKFLPEELAKKHTLEMSTEKIYGSLLLMDVKKRYIGYLKYYDGKPVTKLHFMGLDSKKSNTIKTCKDAQLALANAILKDEDYKVVMEKYYKFIRDDNTIDNFKLSSKLEKHQNEYTTNIPAKRSSLWSNEKLGTKFRGGSKFYIIYVEETSGIDIDVIAFDDIEQLKTLNIKLDKTKYFKDLYNKFDNLIRGIPEINEYNKLLYRAYGNKETQHLNKDVYDIYIKREMFKSRLKQVGLWN